MVAEGAERLGAHRGVVGHAAAVGEPVVREAVEGVGQGIGPTGVVRVGQGIRIGDRGLDGATAGGSVRSRRVCGGGVRGGRMVVHGVCSSLGVGDVTRSPSDASIRRSSAREGRG